MKGICRKCERRDRRGYVLVMVLCLLVLSTTLLVAVSRAATRSALAARSAQEDLQRRWGVASCRKALLPHIEEILGALEQERRQPTANYTMSIRLGGQTFDMILADEQAKANVNAMLEASDLTRSETRIRQGLSGTGLINRIKLRPTIGPVIEPPEPPATPATAPTPATPTPPPAAQPAKLPRPLALTVGAWGQVFDGVPPAQLIRPMPGSRAAPLDLLTCWGNGAINVRRTTEAALTLVGGRSITGVEIGRLMDARNALYTTRLSEGSFDESPGDKLKALMTKTAGESLKNKGNLGLTEGSKCHSLWIITRTGRRDGYDLFVSDESNDKRPVTWAFSW